MRHRRRWTALAATLVCLGLLSGAAAAAAAPHRRGRVHIVGGQDAPAGSLPQLAFIQDEVSAGEYEFCTGTVLSSNVVLTAAHCAENVSTGVLDPASGFEVATGRLDIEDSSTGAVSAVGQVIVHPGFNPSTMDGGDAALLVLTTPTTAPPIALANGSQTGLWEPGTEVEMAGWGLTDGSNPDSLPAQLQWATTVTQTTSYCANEAPLIAASFDAGDQLCVVDAPYYDTSACHGDSGGPLIAEYSTDEPIEVGITSFGPGDCDTSLPNFFTRADAISSWAAGWVAAVAPPPTPAPTPVPTPAPTPTPTPTPARKALAGSYFGDTSQNMQARLKVAPSSATVSRFKISYRLRCDNGRHPRHTLTRTNLPISNLAFGGKLRGRSGATFKVAGKFDTNGNAHGTLTVNLLNSPNGYCHAGPLTWTAWTPIQ